jgi:hypothetical protein
MDSQERLRRGYMQVVRARNWDVWLDLEHYRAISRGSVSLLGSRLPRHGESAVAVNDDMHFEGFGREFLAVVDAIGERNVIGVGHSLVARHLCWRSWHGQETQPR